MADSSALTLVREFTLGPFLCREMTGTADDQAAKAHGGPGKPDFYTIFDWLDTEVACGISAVDDTNVTYGAASSTTAKLFLVWEAASDGGIS